MNLNKMPINFTKISGSGIIPFVYVGEEVINKLIIYGFKMLQFHWLRALSCHSDISVSQFSSLTLVFVRFSMLLIGSLPN